MRDNNLAQLKNFLKEQKIDFFLLPNSDQFFCEYLPESEKQIQYLTGFSGSNATVIFAQDKSYFFTDGRYILQAQNELDLGEFEIFNIAQKSVLRWLEENLGAEKKLALDEKIVSLNFVKSLSFCSGLQSCHSRAGRNPLPRDEIDSRLRGNDKGATLIFLEQNPVDKIWQNRPEPKNSAPFFLDEKITGQSSKAKCAKVSQGLKADAAIISKPENLCWLMNMRGSDVEFSPLFLSYGIIFKNGEVELFRDENDLKKLLQKNITKIQIDPASINYWLHELLEKSGVEIILQKDEIEILKSQKNKVEIAGAIKAHEADGLALTKFLFWLENAQKNGEEIDEIKAEEKLLEFRKEDPNFLYPSFATIAGFASNGAVIHYRATKKTNKKLEGNSLFLIDSGGQYFGEEFCGTTDVTRTIAIGTPTPEMIENFTRVLKGHIALARVKFPRGTTGAQLDALARFHLWNANLDYDHGTGHGVGSFLSVHEGPCGISKRAHQELLEGMILSNEPGFYKDGEYGIRIENLMLVEKFDEKFLCFKTLTLVPIDLRLVDFKMLTRPERKWFYNYHAEILENFSNKYDLQTHEFLQKILAFLAPIVLV